MILTTSDSPKFYHSCDGGNDKSENLNILKLIRQPRKQIGATSTNSKLHFKYFEQKPTFVIHF